MVYLSLADPRASGLDPSIQDRQGTGEGPQIMYRGVEEYVTPSLVPCPFL